MCTPIDINLGDIPMPIKIERDFEYYQVLSKKFDEYYKHIRKIDALGCETIQDVCNNIKIIKNAIQSYFRGNICKAKTLIKDLIKTYFNEEFFVSEFDKSYAFRGISTLKDLQKQFRYNETHEEHYLEMQEAPISLFRGRIAEQNYTTKQGYSAKDMLHIPFDLREKISTGRYSMAGIPCLYLATTTLGCYLELNKPSFDKLYVSSYKVNNNNNIKLLNLRITEMQINCAGVGYFDNDEIKYLQNLVSIFPLVIASSFVVKDTANRSFKTEYIIPQLIMMSINELNVDGVAYLSVHMSNHYAYPQCVNIAIPMFQSKLSDKYSDQLKCFSLTEPMRFSECSNLSSDGHPPTKSHIKQFYNDGNDGGDSFSIIEKENKIECYRNSDFENADDIIIARKHIPCPI